MPTLRVRVKRFRFTKPGFQIADVEGPDGKIFAVVGPLDQLREGDEADLVGDWQLHPRFGEQLRVTSAVPTISADQRGIEGFLARLEHIGPARARAIYERFGEAVFTTIEHSPSELTAIPGLTQDRVDTILVAYAEHRSRRESMVQLKSLGLTDWQVSKVLEWAGKEARQRRLLGQAKGTEAEIQRVVLTETLEHQPYVLTEIKGFGFITVDKIALAAGIERHGLPRACAAIEYVLEEAKAAGHCYLPGQEISSQLHELTGISGAVVATAAAALFERKRIVRHPLPGTSDVAVFLSRLDFVERELAEFFAPRATDLDLQDLDLAGADTLDPEQRAAVSAAVDVDCPAVIVTGGPGTGKTHLVRAICDRFDGLIGLCSPTGKAAKRLAEQTGRPAQTIHRLLSWSPQDETWLHHELNPLPHDLLVVDEASMVDVDLAYALTNACTAATKLVIVGDVDQLPSIGPGHLLRDLIASQRLFTVRLETLHRQSEQSYIAVNARRFNRGEDPILDPKATDFFWHPTDSAEAAFDLTRRLVCETIPKRHGVDPIRDVQVLCPQRKGVIGLHRFNAELQPVLNPQAAHAPSVTSPRGQVFCVGDKVRHTRNNYTLGVMNGETGVVTAIAHAKDTTRVTTDVDYGDRVVTYPDTGSLSEIVLNYASTIHASQGSEYPVVVLLLHSYNHHMLSRNLAYTGLTRARQAVYLVGDEKGLRRALRNTTVARRYTSLAERLRALTPAPERTA